MIPKQNGLLCSYGVDAVMLNKKEALARGRECLINSFLFNDLPRLGLLTVNVIFNNLKDNSS